MASTISDDDYANNDNNDVGYQKFENIEVPAKKPTKKPTASKKTKTDKASDSEILTRALSAGVNVVMGNTLASVEKSTYNPWNAKNNNESSPLNSREIPVGSPGCFDGFTFVITGELPSYSRDTFGDIVKRYGGRITSAVSSKTSFLVIGTDPGSSKVNKAKQLNTPTLDEDSFVALVEIFKPPKDTTSIRPSTSTSTLTNLADDIPFKSENHTDTKLDEKPFSAKYEDQKTYLKSSSIDTRTSETAEIKPKLESMNPTPQLQNQNIPQSTEPKCELWTEKYKPKKLSEICGNKSNIDLIMAWLKNWNNNSGSDKKAILISGPPGIGKTSSVQLIAKELGMNCLEFNASDSRNKESIKKYLGVLSGNHSMTEFLKLKNKDPQAPVVRTGKTVIVMDEVDGMSGGDRGGSAELIKIIDETKVPIICICNDRNSQKVKSLANHCEDIRFKRPSYVQLRSRIMSICHREGLRIDPAAADQLSTATQSDMRQVLNILSTWKLSNNSMTYDQGKKFSTENKKEISIGPFEVIGKYMNAGSYRDMSFYEKINLYFNDFSIMPLMVQVRLS
ncbi:Replication factor C subunit 1 [Smittium culicis]|uniref:Replication factor C subunit 1 n=1 Tax=Smittium culicis TaxID=133412 RepID=A0A1R1XGF3_9FUNG|nr:Replication factor C subunit 1 [Smittium culicis]